MPITKVIYFLEQPFDRRNYERFGIETLQRYGFEISIYDFTPFLHPMAHRALAATETFPFEPLRHLASRNEALAAIEQIDGDDTFVINFIGYMPRTLAFYRALARRKISYAVDVTGAQPISSESSNTSSRFTRLVARLRSRGTKWRDLMDEIRFRSTVAPAGVPYWFAGGTESIKDQNYPRDESTRILWIHSFDYDLYLKERQLPSTDSGKAVFIDQYLPYHPDFIYINAAPPVTPEEYYPKLNGLFQHLQERGISTEVAAHPRANYDARPPCFQGVPLLYGQTAALIRDAKIVIAHSSTAVNLAVLFRKPVMFVTTDQLETTYQKAQIASIAGWLGKRVVNLDAPLDRIDLSGELAVDEECYRHYKNSFICRDGDPEIPFWEVVGDELRRISR